VIRRWDRSRPPTGPYTLNRDDWRAQALVCWYPMGPTAPGYVYDGAGQNHFQTVTAVSPVTGLNGEQVLAFANGSSSVLQSATVPVYAAPLTVACWARKTTAADTVGHGLSSFGDYTRATADGARRFQFDTYGGDVRWLAVGASAGVATKSGISSGRWHHMAGVEVSTTSRYACLDGVAGTQNTTSATPGGTQNRFTIGSIFDAGTNQGHFSGQIGEFAVWSISQYDRRQDLADPGQRYALWYPLRSRKWMWMPLGGAAWTVSITDLASATDAYTHDVTVQASISDLASATDGLVPSLVSVVSLLDSASASDVLTASAVVQASISDLASATDTASATFSAAGVATISDLASATDTYTAAAVVLRALIDAASGTDTYSAATTMVRTLIDPAAATDSYTASAPGAWTVTLTELAAAVDVIAAAYSGTEVHSAPPLLQRLQASARAARVSATRAARTQSSTR
jgi:hypothetical protein